MEQALTFASIILGVAVAFELENLNRLIRSDNVRWHWAQPVFATFVLLFIMFYWWTIARSPDEPISFGEFLPIMWSLVLLTLLAAVALPENKDPEKPVDLAQYYQKNRRYMWGLIVGIGIPFESRWLYSMAQRSETVLEFLGYAFGDLISWATIIAMMFVRRWWMIATGFVILSLGPITWLSRTLG